MTDRLCWYHRKFGDDANKCQPPCLKEVGKQSGRLLVMTGSASQTPSHLLFLMEANSGHQFLIDTGAEVRVIPPSPTERKHRQDCLDLRAVNGSSITTFGTRSLTLDFDLHCVFWWIFVIADTRMPIIGADFLQEHRLLVDMKHRRLVDTKTNLQTHGTISHVVSLRPTFHLQQHNTEYDALLAEFPSVIKPCLPPQPAKHTVTCNISLNKSLT